MLYKLCFAFTKAETEELNTMVTNALESYKNRPKGEENPELVRVFEEIKAGIKKNNDYYFGNAKVSQYNVANRSPDEND